VAGGAVTSFNTSKRLGRSSADGDGPDVFVRRRPAVPGDGFHNVQESRQVTRGTRQGAHGAI